MTETATRTSLSDAVIGLENSQARVGQLLADLQQCSPVCESTHVERAGSRFENQLAMVRLGIATSLFYALRSKHAPTAAHSLRVALSCSAWAERMGMDDPARDRIEVAALLHDLGKIGIPDRILRKPGKLTVEEQLIMDCCPQLGCEILRGCTSDTELLAIVMHANRWFESRRHEDGPTGDALPLGSRMLSIANAFDAMTTDSVYRPAMSRERAIHELIDGRSTQFDPELALDFNRMLEDQPELLHGGVVNRWLRQLQPSTCLLWSSGKSQAVDVSRQATHLFYQQLVGNMKDGVVFTDVEGTVTEWNPVMRELTGIAAEAIVGHAWSSRQIGLHEHDESESDVDFIRDCLAVGSIIARPMILKRNGQNIPVHVQVSPVQGMAPGVHGTVLIIRDLSDQADLEEQLESLHIQTTRDQLTGVSNRAHFDNVLAKLNFETAAGGPTFSLIICDIDHFKRVNDLYGHPAGDDALVRFAAVLSACSREGDLVARYGGEEFLLLAPNCDNATAANRAEAIRQAVEQTSLPSLGGESITASFGVTEYQSGDTPETVLARADRALLKAKDNGRNRVIQLGAGSPTDVSKHNATKRSWLSWFDWEGDSEEVPAQKAFDILTLVPVELAILKLRGFIADHTAEIISVNENQVSLKLNVINSQGGRRRLDQQIALRADLTLSERRGDSGVKLQKTNVHVVLEPIRNRDRRSRELSACCAQVVASLSSYLIGDLVQPETPIH
jgi:diguanylate cyclase (GGDEF)-like protein/PAS domain S-box-containing protein